MSKSPEEKELEAFLSVLPSFRRKEFQHGISSFNQDEMNEWIRNAVEDPDTATAQRQEYERLARRIPALWREYRKTTVIPSPLPANPVGRPKKVALAKEAANLQRAGMNNPQIASALNKRHGTDTTTAGAIRKLLKRHPDKS